MTQALRHHFELAVEGFWLVVGVLFALGGVWELSGTTVSFVPVLLVVVGAVLLYSALMSRVHHRSAH